MGFENIILIDDDYASNYYNTYIIESLKCAKKLVVLNDVDQATDFLLDFEQNITHAFDQFSLIFLDINMPKYSGFELIRQNKNLFISLRSKNVLTYILTTSDNPFDLAKLNEFSLIEGFYPKPLSEESLTSAYNKARTLSL